MICGGGLAGLTLGRQLHLRMPELKVLLIDKQKRPLPEAAFKVGESTVIVGATYLSKVLQLQSYLEKHQLPKFGLRYFFRTADTAAPLETRPELGRSCHVPEISEWQLDRGILENDLRTMLADAGVDLLEGVSVSDIELSQEGKHRVLCKSSSNGEEIEVRGTWVIDAMSRRRFLQKKLGLSRKRGLPYSACWFRVEGRLDVEDFVPASNRAWHDRVEYGKHPFEPTFGRYHSTTHLTGKGYWVWLIPLSSGNTSVGIVCLERDCPWEGYNTYGRAFRWLQDNEPLVAARLKDIEPLDFKVMRDYTYFSERVLSTDRWALSGEAGWFADPFYSPGTDSIAYINCLICEAIALERKGRFTPELCDRFDQEYRQWSEAIAQSIQVGYPLFRDPVVGALKVILDLSFAFGLNMPLFSCTIFRPGFAEEMPTWATPDFVEQLQRTQALVTVLFQLLQDWAHLGRKRLYFQWIDYFSLPYLRDLAVRAVIQKENPLNHFKHSFSVIQELALAIFYLAVADVEPEKISVIEKANSLNPWAISVDSSLWEANGLFQKTTPSMSYESIKNGIVKQFREKFMLG